MAFTAEQQRQHRVEQKARKSQSLLTVAELQQRERKALTNAAWDAANPKKRKVFNDATHALVPFMLP